LFLKQQQMTFKRSLVLPFAILQVLLLFNSALAKGPVGATIDLGDSKTYERGTARAKEELLEFPYRHQKSGNRVYWASVVHEGKKSRLIVKAAEAQGSKDKSGQLAVQDIAVDDPFQEILDQIREDAFNNFHKKLVEQKPLEEDGWKILDGTSAVHKVFYKDSKGKIYCFLGIQEPGKKSLTGPMVVSFQRSQKGPMMSARQGTSWSPPQVVDPVKNAAALKVFNYLEDRKGF
jgi:hypothetical protein